MPIGNSFCGHFFNIRDQSKLNVPLSQSPPYRIRLDPKSVIYASMIFVVIVVVLHILGKITGI